MMRRVLYLPCSPEMPLPALRRMVGALTLALALPKTGERPAQPQQQQGRLQWGMMMTAAAVAAALTLTCLLPRWLLLLTLPLCLLALLVLYPRLVARLATAQGLGPGPSPLLQHMVALTAEEKEARERELDEAVAHGFLCGGGREGGSERAVVLLTGATGFVGHVVLADLLRERARAGAREEAEEGGGGGGGGGRHFAVDTILLLLRPSPKQAPTEGGSGIAARLATLRALPIFAPHVASGAFDAAVVAVEGDVAKPCCGLSSADRAKVEGLGGWVGTWGWGCMCTGVSIVCMCMCSSHLTDATTQWSQLKYASLPHLTTTTIPYHTCIPPKGVTCVVHCAASVLFDQPLAEAAAINVRSFDFPCSLLTTHHIYPNQPFFSNHLM